MVAGQTSFPEVAHCGAEGLTAECPLWVISGHRGTSNQCPLYPRKQTSGHSLNYLLGALLKLQRHIETEGLGGL